MRKISTAALAVVSWLVMRADSQSQDLPEFVAKAQPHVSGTVRIQSSRSTLPVIAGQKLSRRKAHSKNPDALARGGRDLVAHPLETGLDARGRWPLACRVG